MSWDTSPDESHLPGNDAQTELHARLIVVALLAMFVVVLIRTAWLSDDSFINFRTIDNFLHGYGLRWNVAERVQSFTDPPGGPQSQEKENKDDHHQGEDTQKTNGRSQRSMLHNPGTHKISVGFYPICNGAH